MMRVFTPALWIAVVGLAGCHDHENAHGLGICGNSVPEPDVGEECDRGDANADDGVCLPDCRDARCGDGLVLAGVELCDDGPANRDEGPCTPLCAPPSCGDGLLQAPELCDDGDENKAAPDGHGGCSLLCSPLPLCGDGVVHPEFEECDDANLINTDGCTNACTLPHCGDGHRQGDEACDDGNDVDTDNCTNECQYPSCGDGILSDLEECDDGNVDNNDGCLNVCFKASCGDGLVYEGVEECDDGNLIDDDGCNASCFRDRRVFVTKSTYGISDLGDLDKTYLLCGQAAQNAGLSNPTGFRAWTSDGSSSPSTRFDHAGGRYVLVTGEVIAYGWDDLTDGQLLHPIDRTEYGALLDEVPVWTGTKPDGTPYLDGHCDGWSTPSEDQVHIGANDLTDAGWTSWVSKFGSHCLEENHLYCFEARL